MATSSIAPTTTGVAVATSSITPVPAPVPSPFSVAVTHERSLDVYGVRGAVMVIEAEDSLVMTKVGVLKGTAVEWKGELSGVHKRINAVMGKWPEHVDVTFIIDDGASGLGQYYTVSDAGVTFVTGRNKTQMVGVVKRPGGRLALGVPGVPVGKIRFDNMGTRARLPKMTRATRECSIRFNTWLVPYGFRQTPKGVLVSIGQDCSGVPWSEVWKPGRSSKVVEIPGAKRFKTLDYMPPSHLFAGTGETLWFVAGDLLRFDGNTWHVEDIPEGVMLIDGASAGENDVWLLSKDGRVFHKQGDVVDEVPLPAGSKATTIAVDTDGSVVVAAGNTLLRIAASNAEQPSPAQTTPAQATPAQATPAQATPAQATPAQATPAQATPAQATPAQPSAAPPKSE